MVPCSSPGLLRAIMGSFSAASLALGMQIALCCSAADALRLDGSMEARCAAETFDGLLAGVPEARVESVQWIEEGMDYGEGAANLGYPSDATGLPELCAVTVDVSSSETSHFRFGLFLPTGWNKRFLTMGNGGFAGGINWLDMGPGTHYGFSVMSTDTGHNSSVADLSWALNRPEQRTDWGWRAVHGSAELAKSMVGHFYGTPARYSYYNGCSTGGRQGLVEVQRFPDTFDGALVGAPSWHVNHLNPLVARAGMDNLPASPDNPAHIPADLFPVIAAEVNRQCDGADGVADGIVSAPQRCVFDFSRLHCDHHHGSAPPCLTDEQVRTAIKIYSDFVDPETGEFLGVGLLLGSEAQWSILYGGEEPSPFGTGYIRYFVLDDEDWDWRTYNHSLIRLAEAREPGGATADRYDLSAFRDRGGKIIMYHGVADGLVPTKGSTLYYERVQEAMGLSAAAAADFFRYFMIPGMQHCWDTSTGAPWNIAGAYQTVSMGSGLWSVPGFEDARHDALLALVAWVEEGTAPRSIVATTWNESLDHTSGVLRQRPICPYPEEAVWDRVGDVDDAASWSCARYN